MVDLTSLFKTLKIGGTGGPYQDSTPSTDATGAAGGLSPNTGTAISQPGTTGDSGNQGFITNVLNTLMGVPDADKTPTQLRQTQQDRANASQKANQASQDEGESFMQAPNAGGSGFGLQDIAHIVQTLFK